MRRRAIYVNCDGLGRDWISKDLTPAIWRLRAGGLWCADHRAIFPSATRASAASIATGCWPKTHGLLGNRMALLEEDRLIVHDVSKPDFFEHLRKVTGATLRVPTVAERLSRTAESAVTRFVAYSNVSAGAAFALDPDGYGFVHHRSRSIGPGRTSLAPLEVSHDGAGDREMAAQFMANVLAPHGPDVGVIWFADPDITLHHHPLGSEAHLDAVRQTDALVGAIHQRVRELRDEHGLDVLLLVGSDHGHEPVAGGIDLAMWAREHGYQDELASGRLAFATQGTSFVISAYKVAGERIDALLDAVRSAHWAADVVCGRDLEALGYSTSSPVVATVDMGRIGESGQRSTARWAAFESDAFSGIGNGQHGGLGELETIPFLVAEHPEVPRERRATRTSLIDIAPTILSFLGTDAGELDGQSILSKNSA